jgi:hypothetical protein
MGGARSPAKDHLRADSGLGRSLGLGRGLGSVWGCVLRTACASISRSSALVFAGARGVSFHEVISSTIWAMKQAKLKPSAPSKGHVMSKRENEANNVFRPSASPLTEHEKEQIALRKNLERLKAERLVREAEQKDRRKS